MNFWCWLLVFQYINMIDGICFDKLRKFRANLILNEKPQYGIKKSSKMIFNLPKAKVAVKKVTTTVQQISTASKSVNSNAKLNVGKQIEEEPLTEPTWTDNPELPELNLKEETTEGELPKIELEGSSAKMDGVGLDMSGNSLNEMKMKGFGNLPELSLGEEKMESHGELPELKLEGGSAKMDGLGMDISGHSLDEMKMDGHGKLAELSLGEESMKTEGGPLKLDLEGGSAKMDGLGMDMSGHSLNEMKMDGHGKPSELSIDGESLKTAGELIDGSGKDVNGKSVDLEGHSLGEHDMSVLGDLPEHKLDHGSMDGQDSFDNYEMDEWK
ncbi:hypothetical protein SNEBB_005104 [Seison nebaliae]|nr:hypothetical protein SNEBB_005104 [Seison nebaliae]